MEVQASSQKLEIELKQTRDEVDELRTALSWTDSELKEARRKADFYERLINGMGLSVEQLADGLLNAFEGDEDKLLLASEILKWHVDQGLYGNPNAEGDGAE